jgi:hypothetical protein
MTFHDWLLAWYERNVRLQSPVPQFGGAPNKREPFPVPYGHGEGNHREVSR